MHKKLLLLVTALHFLGAACAHASESHRTYSYNGQSLEALSQKSLEREDLAPGLSVVTGYSGTGDLKASWITRTGTHVATTLNLWNTPCRSLGKFSRHVADRRSELEAVVYFDADAKLTQIGSYCWVSYGSEAQQLDVLNRLLALPADQGFPSKDRPAELVAALGQLNQFMKSGSRQQTAASRWKNLVAGQPVSSPEQAAIQAGFAEAQVAARASDQGVGYLLHCGPKTVVGQAGLATISRTTGRVNQFAAYVTANEAAGVLTKQLQVAGKPGRESTENGRTTYFWFAGEVTTSFEQQSDGSWLYMWTNTSCRAGSSC